DRRSQEWFHNGKHLGIPLSLVALGILLGCPEADGKHRLLSRLLSGKRQNLQEAGLLLEDGQDLVFYNLHEFFFLVEFHFEIKNTGKHGRAPFPCEIKQFQAGAIDPKRLQLFGTQGAQAQAQSELTTTGFTSAVTADCECSTLRHRVRQSLHLQEESQFLERPYQAKPGSDEDTEDHRVGQF